MSHHPHSEKHFTAGAVLRDVIIGMSDGLTVPFALAAGLSGTTVSAQIIVTAGIAEIAAGSIAMGLGGYLAAKGEWEHYHNELKREQMEIKEKPEAEREEVRHLLKAYGLTSTEVEPVVEALSQRPKDWVDFMMRFELGLEKIDPKRARWSAITISSAYMMGGFIPLLPYILQPQPILALKISAFTTIIALMAFGFLKGTFLGIPPFKSAFQTAAIGGLAALAAFMLARAIS